MKVSDFEDSRLLFLWKVNSYMLLLKILLIRNKMFINQRKEEFSLAFLKMSIEETNSFQPFFEAKIIVSKSLLHLS